MIATFGLFRFHLLGHSMGGGIASLVAAAFPERVSSLFLIEGMAPAVRDADKVVMTLGKSLETFNSALNDVKRGT